MKEDWKPVRGYPNYEVSNWGGVRSLDHWARGKPGTPRQWRQGKVLTPQPNTGGHLQVQLFKKGFKKKFWLVHRLVAIAFIPNPTRRPFVNHKYGIKTDNAATGLEWATKKEDSHHAWKTGLIKPIRGKAHWNYKHGRHVGKHALWYKRRTQS